LLCTPDKLYPHVSFLLPSTGREEKPDPSAQSIPSASVYCISSDKMLQRKEVAGQGAQAGTKLNELTPADGTEDNDEDPRLSIQALSHLKHEDLEDVDFLLGDDDDDAAIVPDDDFAEDSEADDGFELGNPKRYSVGGPRPLTSVIPKQTEEEKVKTFQQRVKNTVQFLTEEARKSTFQDILSKKGG
jgi:hypothetical protein